MQTPSSSSLPIPSPTLLTLINSISFSSKKQKQKLIQKDPSSQSVSGSSLNDSPNEFKPKKERSKAWTQQENFLFLSVNNFQNQLVEKYGTDFTLMKEFFPRKSKGQIKKKYKSEWRGLGRKEGGFNNLQKGQESRDDTLLVKNAVEFGLASILGSEFVMITEEEDLGKQTEEGEKEKEKL